MLLRRPHYAAGGYYSTVVGCWLSIVFGGPRLTSDPWSMTPGINRTRVVPPLGLGFSPSLRFTSFHGCDAATTPAELQFAAFKVTSVARRFHTPGNIGSLPSLDLDIEPDEHPQLTLCRSCSEGDGTKTQVRLSGSTSKVKVSVCDVTKGCQRLSPT